MNPPLRVLLAEPSAEHLSALLLFLDQGGVPLSQVTQATRLQDALRHLAGSQIDICLLSLSLSDGRGLEAVRAIRAAAPEMPVVILATAEDESFAVAATEDGAQDYLLKPVADGHLLVKFLRYVIERSRIVSILRRTPERPGGEEPREAPFAAAHWGAQKRPFAHRVTSTHTHPAEGQPKNPLREGQAVGPYTVDRLLGCGGMGTVYLAVQQSLDRKVALKVLSDHFTQDGAFIRRFEREASALSNLNHPNIVAIIDRGTHLGLHYFVMEYVGGMSLREAIGKRTLTMDQTLKIVPHLCEAIDYAHTQGVIHRDIKPENLLFSHSGQIKISDFGLARLAQPLPDGGKPLTYTGTLMGTKDYMAPETRCPNRRCDHRVDIYSLGVVLYEMLTGELPIGRFLPPSEKAPVDRRLDAVILRALESDPDRRYQRATDLAQDFVQVVRDGSRPQKALRSPPLLLEERLPSDAGAREVPFPSWESFQRGKDID